MRILILTLCLCLQMAMAAAANVSLMPIRDLRPGMQGVGKTVIQGDTIEEFNVEILGVQGSETSGYSVFVRLYGDLIEKTGGVAQGMSGSPVYVDGRLVGAVAFWTSPRLYQMIGYPRGRAYRPGASLNMGSPICRNACSRLGLG